MSTIHVCDYCGEAISPDWHIHVGAIGNAEDHDFDGRMRDYHGDIRAGGRTCWSIVRDALDGLRSDVGTAR
jgi:hypothetical protein